MGMRVSITSTFEIAAAHQLPYHRGKCKRLHGHNYRLEFTRYGQPKPLQTTACLTGQGVALPLQDGDTGMVMDFGDFDGAIKAVLGLVDDDRLDHRSLNEFLPNPTAEHLAAWLLEQLPLVDRVVVWETGRHCATAERTPDAAPRPRRRVTARDLGASLTLAGGQV